MLALSFDLEQHSFFFFFWGRWKAESEEEMEWKQEESSEHRPFNSDIRSALTKHSSSSFIITPSIGRCKSKGFKKKKTAQISCQTATSPMKSSEEEEMLGDDGNSGQGWPGIAQDPEDRAFLRLLIATTKQLLYTLRSPHPERWALALTLSWICNRLTQLSS